VEEVVSAYNAHGVRLQVSESIDGWSLLMGHRK
jgi:hypothetical protein